MRLDQHFLCVKARVNLAQIYIYIFPPECLYHILLVLYDGFKK